MSARAPVAAAGLVAAAVAFGGSGAAGDAAPLRLRLLRLDGIGPLELGMTRTAAVRTGWLGHPGRGCPLGGRAPVTYRLVGRRAPSGLRATAEFDGARLRNLSFEGSVRTSVGVALGRTTTAEMARRYRRAGYDVATIYSPTFGGTFVTVTLRGRAVIGGFGTRRTVTLLAVPSVPVCE